MNITKGRLQNADAPYLHPYVALDQGGKLNGQLIMRSETSAYFCETLLKIEQHICKSKFLLSKFA